MYLITTYRSPKEYNQKGRQSTTDACLRHQNHIIIHWQHDHYNIEVQVKSQWTWYHTTAAQQAENSQKKRAK